MDLLQQVGVVLGLMFQEEICFLCGHSYRKKIEIIVNKIIKFGKSLTDFFIGNHMNTPNELNSVWKMLKFQNGKFCHSVDRHVVTTINRYA